MIPERIEKGLRCLTIVADGEPFTVQEPPVFEFLPDDGSIRDYAIALQLCQPTTYGVRLNVLKEIPLYKLLDDICIQGGWDDRFMRWFEDDLPLKFLQLMSISSPALAKAFLEMIRSQSISREFDRAFRGAA